MHSIKQDTKLQRGKHLHANAGNYKGRPCIIDKGEQAIALLLRDLTVSVKVNRRTHSQGESTQGTKKKREKEYGTPRLHRVVALLSQGRDRRPYKIREEHKGKKCGNDRFCTESECGADTADHCFCVKERNKKKREGYKKDKVAFFSFYILSTGRRHFCYLPNI